MNDIDLIEFFIYLRDHCYNRDFSIEPKKVVECFYEYRNNGYKIAKQKSDSVFCDCIKEPWDGADVNGDCVHCGRKHK